MNTPRNRVVVIVLNEATLDLIERWAADGSLPVCRSILQGGISGRLWSRFPLFGPERWGNLVTGQSADQHGLTEFLHRERGDFSPIRYGARHGLEAEPVWRTLSRAGRRCVLINTPVGYPEDVPGGVVLQELLDAYAWRRERDESWRRRMSTPEIYDEVLAKFGPMEVSVHDVGKAELIPLLEAQLDRQFRVMSWLLGERLTDWSFCLTRLTQVADAQHYLWADQDSSDADPAVRDGMRRAYLALDRGLGSLMENLGPETTFMVVSDCGAGPLQAGVQLNTWLEMEGFQVQKPRAAQPAGGAPASNGGGTSLRSLARTVLPRPVIRALGTIRRRLRPEAPEGPIDWSRTRAYAVGVDSGIAINLKGREAGGIVAPGAEYRAVRDEVIGRLEALIDPETGEPAVDGVLTAEQLYGERIAARAPDLVVEWRGSMYLPVDLEDVPGAVFVSHRLKGKVLPTTGGHRRDGLLLAKGPDIPVAQRPQGSVFDLVPTCLELLDVPPGPGLRGKSLLR